MNRLSSAALALIVCVAAPALAQVPQPGRLDVVIGYAYAQRAGERPAVAYQYDRIAIGQTLSTVTESAANLRLPEGVELTLGDSAAAALAPGESGRTLLVLERGAMRIRQTGPGRTTFRAAGLDLVAEGADITLVLTPGLSRINVRAGQVSGAGLMLGARQTATLAPGAAPVITPFATLAYGQTGDRQLDQALFNGRGLQPPQQNMGFGR